MILKTYFYSISPLIEMHSMFKNQNKNGIYLYNIIIELLCIWEHCTVKN